MKNKQLRWLLLALLACGIVLAIVYRDRLDAEALQQWMEQAGAAAPLLFMLIYAIGTVLFLPGSVLTLAGGALFGPILGTFYNLTGATVGAVLEFLIARYLASDWVEQKTGGYLKRLKEGVENEGWRFVAFRTSGTDLPLQPAQLCTRADPYLAISLSDCHLCMHAARRFCLHLPGIRRP
jgi:uncharacterized membrane protein YdjX (TVP38/TMEM64 family)